MRQLLLVSYAFPPQRNPESLLVLATVRGLARSGWAITVLTIDPAQTTEAIDQDLLEEVPPSVSVVRAGGFEHWLSGFPALRRSFWYGLRLLGLPERSCAWYFPALRAGRRLLRKQRFDVMHSWANYQVSNLVALGLRREFHLPWVVHFSDPWTDSPYFRARATTLQRLSCARFERRIVEESDAVVFVTPETARLVMRKYSNTLAAKARIVPHGYDPDMLAGIPTVPESDLSAARPLLLVHVGAFYPGLREPVSLLKALAMVDRERPLAGRLQLRLVGPYTERYRPIVQELGLVPIVDLCPPVSRRESLIEAVRADVLLVIDAPSSGESVFLPSKLVDYLIIRKPILGLTAARGATARVLSEAGLPVAVADDVASIADAINQLLLEHDRGPLALPANFDGVASRYNISLTTGELSSILESAADAALESRAEASVQ